MGCVILLSACRQTDFTELNTQKDFYLTCSKSGWISETRAITDSEGKGDFSEGDQISVAIASDEKTSFTQLEYNGGKWTPSLNCNDYGKGPLTLSALFPVLPQIENDNQTTRHINLPLNQSIKENNEAADVLFGSTQINSDASSASLEFRHALHRLCIKLKGAVPADLQIEIRSRNEGQISLIDGTSSPDQDAVYTWIKPLKQDDGTYTAIILPQDAASYQNGEGLIRLTTNDKSFTYKLNADIRSFDAGMQTNLNLTLKQAEDGEEGGEVDLDFSNQKLWVYGITSPVFPGKENIRTYPMTTWITNFNEGEWMRYDYQSMDLPYEENYLTWKEGCGWYDCSKTFNYDGDDRMCWAATASNLIHWWLANNKKYVEKYEAEYGGEPCPKEYHKMTEENQQHSEVFNFFKRSYPNIGSWETGGVNWFINGDKRNLIYSYNEEFPGFFHQVFSTEHTIATETRNTSKKNFNLWIKDAFKNHKAIGFSVIGFAGSKTRLHAMTIWGAEFDEEGNVSFLYFCDNNLSDNEPNYSAVRRFKVTYSDSTQGTYLVPLDYNDGTQPTVQTLICSVTLVDLRQDIWKAKYPNL